MTAIGVIDDRTEDRNLIVETIDIAKNSDAWAVVANSPLTSLEEYPAWIAQNKICVLIVDEMLNEELKDGVAVQYKGHELVDFIRKKLPTLPIFVITSYSQDALLQDRFGAVEGIIERNLYSSDYHKYVERIIRAAQKYLTVFQDELNRLSDFASKAANGEKINESERLMADAIQTKLGIAYSINSIADINHWLEEADGIVERIEQLQQEIINKIGDTN